jgi:hypothetical protein
VKGIWKTKTFWAAIAGIATALGGWISGEVNASQSILLIVGFLISIFFRDALLNPK